MKSKGILTGVLLSVFVFSAFGQINLLSDDITFRTNSSGDKSKLTYHYGCLKAYSISSYGLFASNEKTSGTIYGVYGAADAQPSIGIGGHFIGGYYGIRAYGSSAGTGTRYGGYFYAGNTTSGSSYGIRTYAVGSYGTKYGIRAISTDAGGTNYAGYFDGDVVITGETLPEPSDQKFKKNLEPIVGALDNVMLMKPQKFDYNLEKYPNMGFSNRKTLGLVAQDLEGVIPELVREIVTETNETDENGNPIEGNMISFKAINYIGLIPVLVGAIQEQQKEIEALKAKLQ